MNHASFSRGIPKTSPIPISSTQPSSVACSAGEPTPPRLSSVALIRDKPLGPTALFLAVLDGSIDRAELMRRISR
jgi:hypothetical protein